MVVFLGELTASGMMTLANVQTAPLSPTTCRPISDTKWQGSTDAAEEGAVDGTKTSQQHHLDAPSLVKHEYLGMELTAADLESVQEFELAWANFVQEKADLNELPKGEREKTIERLQEQVKALREEQETMELNLLKQVSFVRQQCDELPFVYGTKIAVARQERREAEQVCTERLHKVIASNQLQEETLPWFHFVRQLDLQASLMMQGGGSHATDKTAMRPSARAMRLLASSSSTSSDSTASLASSDNIPHDADRQSQDIRAYRTDHALLTTHVRMLHKEIERYEKMVETQEWAGTFLTKHNVWKILSTPQEEIDALQETISEDYEQELVVVPTDSDSFYDCQEEKKEEEAELHFFSYSIEDNEVGDNPNMLTFEKTTDTPPSPELSMDPQQQEQSHGSRTSMEP